MFYSFFTNWKQAEEILDVVLDFAAAVTWTPTSANVCHCPLSLQQWPSRRRRRDLRTSAEQIEQLFDASNRIPGPRRMLNRLCPSRVTATLPAMERTIPLPEPPPPEQVPAALTPGPNSSPPAAPHVETRPAGGATAGLPAVRRYLRL